MPNSVFLVHVNVLREQSEQEVKSAEARVGEEVRKHLVKEYMAKFREVTEKLQQVHQSELSALQQEKLLSETRHSEELDRLREEVEERHQHDISQIMESHKHELTGLQELYEAKLRQAESEHAVKVSEFQQQFETLQNSEQQGMEATVRLVPLSWFRFLASLPDLQTLRKPGNEVDVFAHGNRKTVMYMYYS